MKILTFLVALISFTSCSKQITADKLSGEFPRSTPTVAVNNSPNSNAFRIEEIKNDQSKLVELNAQNKKFEETPQEFKNINWKNFKFNNIRLKNGEFEILDKKHTGGTSYSLGSIYYVDLFGDTKKEAIVFLSELNCGGSCDGGRSTIFLYKSQLGKPTLINSIKTGSTADGCEIKSLTVKDKKIYLEQFGICKTNTDKNEDKSSYNKFCVKDLTKSVYSISANSKLEKEAVEVVETPIIKIMNYISEIGIKE